MLLFIVTTLCITSVYCQPIPPNLHSLLMNPHIPKIPDFCHGLDCPRYSVMKSTAGYELRRYEASKWVATNKTTMTYTSDDNREMFYRLFHYISGNNQKNVTITMTTPVIRKVSHGPGPTCESDFVMYFMVPFDMQSNTPQPTDPNVYLIDMPQMNVFVKSFGGKPSEDDKIHQLEQLAADIGDYNAFESSYFFTAGYDGPYTLKRHNEVWLHATV